MEELLAAAAAVAASGFAADLWIGHHRRPRRHALLWALAMSMYAVATWALVWGLAVGWTGPVFRVFYYLGAIANIVVLAAGSVALNASRRTANAFLIAVAFFLGLAAASVVAAPAVSIPSAGVPEGSEVFGMTFAAGGLTLPGPRVFAILSGTVGTIVIVGYAVAAVVRFWRTRRRLAVGNLLILGGALAPAAGGSLTGLGEGGGLAISLLVGATLLWAGYRVATGEPRG